MRLNNRLLGAIALAAMLVLGCQTAPKTEEAKADLESEAQSALNRMKAEEPSIANVIEKGYGHVIFPSAGKGGLIVGGGYGRGIVYEQGPQVGFADITQLSVGAQVGGQAFSELIVFENKAALDRFKNNQVTFAADASAVIVKKGVATSAKFQDGVAVFVMPKAGAMAQATVGGQKFTFTPTEGSGRPATRPAQRASDTQSDANIEVRTGENKTEIKTQNVD